MRLKNILMIIIGAGLFSFGLNYLVMPNGLYEGGATGLTLILYYLFKIQPWVMNIIINIPLFILGWKISAVYLGMEDFRKTHVASQPFGDFCSDFLASHF